MSNYSHYTQCAQLLDNQSKRIQNLKLEYLTFFAIKIGNTKGKQKVWPFQNINPSFFKHQNNFIIFHLKLQNNSKGFV